jgi:hypothetical protein
MLYNQHNETASLSKLRMNKWMNEISQSINQPISKEWDAQHLLSKHYTK